MFARIPALRPKYCWALPSLFVWQCAFAAETSPVELPEVQVVGTTATGQASQGYRVDTVKLGPLGDVDLQEAPLSVTTVSADLIRNTGAANSTDALKYVPTVYANTGASQITPYFTLRGFTASQTALWNSAVDGMRSFDIYQPVEEKERIDVLSGASAFLYGISSPAGMINYVSKRPTSEPLRELTVGAYDQQTYGQLDLGGPLADGLAYRLNLAYGNDGDTGVEHQSQKREVASFAMDWHPRPDTTLSLEAGHSRREVDYAQALFMTTAAIGIPTAPDASKNWGAPYTFAHDETNRIGAALSSRLNEVFSLRAQVRHSDIEREYRLNRQVWQNASLAYRWRLDSQDPFRIQVDQYNLFLDADFTTGPLHHRLSLGTSSDDYDKGYDGARSQTFATTYPGNLYGGPTYPALTLPTAGASLAQRTRYDSLLLTDRIAIGERWELMLGLNQAKVDDKGYSKNVATGVVTTTAYHGEKTTPAFSLSFKPLPALTTYLAYTEALQQGFTSTTTGNAGAVFAPYVGKQKEVGAKASIGGLALTLAWFDIDQANQYTDPTTQVSSQDGREIHKGWEFTLTGKVTSRLTLVGGFTALDARIDKATANVGKTPQGVPERMARLYAEYELPGTPGLALTGGLSYTGRAPWDAANTLYAAPATVADAGLRYRALLGGKDTTFRFNVANLAGKDYWTTRSGILYLGNPRIVSFSATVAF